MKTDVLGLLRQYLYGSMDERMSAASVLADLFDDASDSHAADALRAAPSLTAAPNILTLARPLAYTEKARLCGKLLSQAGADCERDWRGLAGIMLHVMTPDDRGDLCEALTEQLARMRSAQEWIFGANLARIRDEAAPTLPGSATRPV